MPLPGVFKRYFHRGRHVVLSEYIENTLKTRSNAIEMSQAFPDIAWFEHFTDLNLLEHAFNVIQNWQTDALQFNLFDDAYFLLAVMVEGDESSQLRVAN